MQVSTIVLVASASNGASIVVLLVLPFMKACIKMIRLALSSPSDLRIVPPTAPRPAPIAAPFPASPAIAPMIAPIAAPLPAPLNVPPLALRRA